MAKQNMTDIDKERALWLEHRSFARCLAMSFMKRFPKVRSDDLFAAAETGLWEVVSKYQDLEPKQLRAMIIIRVRGALLDEIRTLDWLPRRARRTYGERFCRLFLDGMTKLDRQWVEAEFSTDIDVDLAMDHADRARRLEEAIDALPRRDAYIIRRVLSGDRQFEVAEDLGVSEPRVAQIVGRLTKTLQTALRRHRLKATWVLTV